VKVKKLFSNKCFEPDRLFMLNVSEFTPDRDGLKMAVDNVGLNIANCNIPYRY
jgi:hypothetical protein